jgi:glucose/arabinose dehydrogenase/regulation of enolase protein 1 (concanavalin A-like superfamily)
MGAATLPAGFEETVVFSGLVRPTAIQFASDGRVFVAEKSGIIKVFDSLSDTTPTVFADLRTKVHNYWDRGLLGLALHPNFPSVPYVYVLYTHDAPIGGTAPVWGSPGATTDTCPNPPGDTIDGCAVSARLSRLQASGNVMTGTEQVLVEDWFQQYPSHSIGSLVFGNDGALYVSGGDGASFYFTDYGQKGIPLNPGGDPPVGIGGVQTPPSAEGGALRSQDLRTSGDPVGLDGTVLRLDPATGAAMAGNPLAANPDANARRIIAYGLRNPFRMAFRPGTSELWIGDVGYNTWEEINRIPSVSDAVVENFGWPCYEGVPKQSAYEAANLSLCENLYATPAAVTAPYFSYHHLQDVVPGEPCPNGSSSISAISFYSGSSYPAPYSGALFFGDYSRQCLWVMPKGTNGQPDPAAVKVFGAGVSRPVDLKPGPGGDLFYVDLLGGTVRRIQYTGANQSPTAVIQAVPTSGPAPLQVQFDASGSSDPNLGDTLTYDWDLNGDGAYGDATSATPTFLYTVPKSYTVHLRVTDPGSASATSTVVITAGDSPPTATIVSPSPTFTWKVGDTINFSGSATDAKDGPLPASALSWSLLLHHCPATCHVHPIQDFPGVASGSFTAPDHDYPSHLELQLTATDSGGLTDSKSLTLNPQTVTLGLQSSPPGLQLVLGSGADTAPFSRTVIVGSANTLSAPLSQTLGLSTYQFENWSTAKAPTHLITAPASPATYVAAYGEALPDPWLDQDVGPVTAEGTAVRLGAAFAVTGSGSDIWNNSDRFHFAYQALAGDGEIRARVVSVDNSNGYAKAGVMIRQDLTSNSPHAMMLIEPSKVAAFMWRPTAGAMTFAAGSAGAAPHWVRLVRVGSNFTGYRSSDGSNWIQVGTTSVNMTGTVYVGLAVTSHNSAATCTAVFDNVTLNTVPPPWLQQDIGAVGVAGSASYSNGSFAVQGSGADVFGASDQFHFVYRPLSGDGEIVARVASVQNTSSYAKAGVMIRESLTNKSPHAMMLIEPGNVAAFIWRLATGATTSSVGATAAAPQWVRLVRSGSSLTGFRSADGTNWIQVGTATVNMSGDVYVGLALTAHNNTVNCTAVFDGVATMP